MSWSAVRASGDSQLQLPEDIDRFEASYTSADGDRANPIRFSLTGNHKRRLAYAATRLRADSITDALSRAHGALEGYLSLVAFAHQVPIHAIAWHVIELATGTERFRVRLAGPIQQLDLSVPYVDGTTAEAKLLSIHREAINARSSANAALHYYRLIEKVHALRTERAHRTTTASPPYRVPSERVPDSIEQVPAEHAIDVENFTPYLGRKFTAIWDKDLRDKIRNAIAHPDSRTNELSADRYSDLVAVDAVLPVLRYIAVEMLTRERLDQAQWPTPADVTAAIFDDEVQHDGSADGSGDKV